MKNKIFKTLKYLLKSVLIAIPIGLLIGYFLGARVHYDDNPLALNWHNEGPYIFIKKESVLTINYIKANKTDGFYFEQKDYPIDSLFTVKCYYPLDSTSFDFKINSNFETPNSVYNDGFKILAISDIESNFKTFRDFLIGNKVIDKDLNWTFAKGHLVLVGDFIDRGYFTTQVLWFIYKLEQEAQKHGGFVHYIIGNHELKMMHGNYGVTDPKDLAIATILDKQQLELYNSSSLIGKWLSSKNAIELINGNLFVHGGIHPGLADSKLGITEMNQIIRRNYYTAYKPGNNKDEEELILSNDKGPCWYRGYFNDGLTQQQIDLGLDKFNANTVIVGHTIQAKVNRLYSGKVIAIDVQHPNDDHKLWPEGKSEGLLIEGNNYYRVFNNGKKEKI